MKKNRSWINRLFTRVAPAILPVIGLLAAAPVTYAAAFTPGNLAILSADSATANNTTFSIVEINTATAGQSAVQTISINGTSGGSALRMSGSAATCGGLSDSADGSLLVFSGENTTSSSGNITSTTARGVGTLNSSGTFALPATYTGITGNQTRGATTLDNSAWDICDQGGAYTGGSSSPSYAGNILRMKAFGNTVYVMNAGGLAGSSVVSSWTVGSSSLTALTGLPTAADAAAKDFFLISSGNNGSAYDILYQIDETSATVGTISKYSLVSGTWTANGTYTTSFGGVSICAAVSGGGAVLYCVTGVGSTAANSVVKLTDTAGYNATINITTGNNVTLFTTTATPTLKSIAFAPLPPTITGAATATAFTTTYGTASTAQSFPVSGTRLTASLTATAPTGFEVSSDGSTYGSTATFTQSGGSASGTLYVRLKATAAVSGSYNSQNIVLSSTGATSVNVTTASSGNSVSAKALSITANDVSTPLGTALSSPVTGSTAFTSSGLANGETIGSVTITYGSHANATTGGTYPGEVTPSAAAGGTFTAGNYSITYNSGTLTVTTTPTLTVTGGPLSFGAVAVSGTSGNLTYTVAGAFLTANLVITPPANFEISTSSGSGFVANPSTLTLTQSGGTVATTTIYVHFKPTAQQAYSGTSIANTSSGATEQDVAVSGTGANAPSVTTQAATLVTTGGATLNGTVTANNNTAITDRGFYYNTSGSVSTSDTQVDEGGTTVAAYSKAISGLGVNTEYFYRAYAVNAIGTTLVSSDTTFWTLANAPTAAPVVSTVPGITTANNTTLTFAFAPGSDGNPAGTKYAIKETGTGKFLQSGGTLGASADFELPSAWTAVTVTGLNPGTAYTFEAEAQNGASVATGFGPAATAFTANQPFTAGDLAVYSADNTTANSTISVIELNPVTAGQTAVQTFSINGTVSPSALRTSGSAGSTGLPSDSSDGSLFCFAGFEDTSASTADETTILPRGVATLNALGDYVLQASYTGITSDQARSATTPDNSTWFMGDKAGIYISSGGSAPTAPATAVNIRPVKSFGGTVYALSANTAPFISSVDSSGTQTALAGLNTVDGKGVDFYMVSSRNNGVFDTLYYLDQTNATSGAIYKYSLVSGTWTANGKYATSFGGVGICAAPATDGTGGTYLYVTSGAGSTAANNVIKLHDTAGFNATIAITTGNNVTLYTAAAGTTIKGIAFAPGFVKNCTRADGVTLKIPVSDLTGLAAGLDGCSYSFNAAAGSSASGSTLTYNGTYVYYTNSTPVNTNDSFTYSLTATVQSGSPLITGSVTAGSTFTVTGMVNIGAAVGLAGQRSGSLSVDGLGNVHLTFYGIPGRSYQIQRTASLSPAAWANIGSPVTADSTTGVITATDSLGTGSAYYQLIAP